MQATNGLGKTIRDARFGQGLALADVEARTGVPTKYLRALEWERFDLLSDERTAREAIKAYADCVGLDAESFLVGHGARDAALPRPQPEAPQERRRMLGADSLPVLIILIPAFVAIAGVLAVERLSGPKHHAASPASPPATRTVTARPAPPPPVAPAQTREQPVARPPSTNPSRSPTPPPVVHMVTLEVSAPRGDSWVVVRSGSSHGPILFEGTLEKGRTLSLERRRLWLRLGAATNLDVLVNGSPPPVELYGTLDAIVSAAGFRKVPLAM